MCYHGFEPKLCQTKEYKIGFSWFSTKHTVFTVRTLKNQNKCVGLVQSKHYHHWNITCSCHDIAEKIAHIALYNNHSFTQSIKEL